ncbi:MAG: hypothetical protein WCH57_05490 [Verrucomicrobiota bacterium]
MSTEESEKVSVLTERIDNLIGRIDKFEEIAEARFVTKAEFSPVQKLVYGGAGIVLSLVLAALLGAVILNK